MHASLSPAGSAGGAGWNPGLLGGVVALGASSVHALAEAPYGACSGCAGRLQPPPTSGTGSRVRGDGGMWNERGVKPQGHRVQRDL